MNQISDLDLVELGRAAAENVAALGSFEMVEVTARQDSSDEPAYFFTFLSGDLGPRPGLARIRLVQNLRDKLMARHDNHYPFVTVLSRADWEKRKSA